MNKFKYGLKNVHYAPLTIAANGTPTFGVPVPFPGAVSLRITKSNGNLLFYADDGEYVNLGDNSSFEADLECALIPENFRIAALGEALDNNGVLMEDAIQKRDPFALLFEFSEDEKAVRHVLYNCTASEEETGSETRGENLQVRTENLKIKARPLEAIGKVKMKTGESTDAATYGSWYESVYLPTASGNGQTPAVG